MNPNQLKAAIIAMKKANDFISTNVRPSAKETVVRHELNVSILAMRAELKKVQTNSRCGVEL